MLSKIFAFPLMRLVLILAGATGVTILVQILIPRRLHPSALSIEGLLFVLVLGITLVVERLCAGQSLPEIGFVRRDAAPDTAKGFALGALLFTVVVAVLALAHCYSATFDGWSSLPQAVLLFFVIALFEEFLFRGVVFRLIEAMTGTWIALVISALLFGGLHITNHGATIYSSLAIAIEAGVLLGLAFALTRSLWFAIGIHWAWNLFEGPVFGAQVSGNTLTGSVLHATIVGPAWLTGGAFGPEAGIIPIVLCVAVAIPIARAAIRRGNIVPPMWAAAAAPVTP